LQIGDTWPLLRISSSSPSLQEVPMCIDTAGNSSEAAPEHNDLWYGRTVTAPGRRIIDD